MTKTEALAAFAKAYRVYQLSKDVPPSNLEVAVAYATMDVANMTKTMSEANAIYVIADETSVLTEALAKRAA